MWTVAARGALVAAALSLTGAAVAVGPAGASSTGSESASTIVAQATAAMAGLMSLTVKGSGLDGKATLNLDIITSTDGDAQGSLTEQGSTIDLIEVGSTGYLRGNQKFFTTSGVPKSEAATLAGKWLDGPSTSQPFSSFTAFLDLSKFVASFNDAFAGSVFTKSGTAKVDGKRVVVVTGYDAKNKDGGRLYIQATGSPYILKEVSTGKNNTGTVVFSGLNQTVTTTAPAGAVSEATYGL
jgi:hypothetical protein